MHPDDEDLGTSARELPLQVWVMTLSGELEWANHEGLELDAVHPRDAPELMEALQGALEAEHPFDHEVRMRAPDGGYRWVEVQAWPVRRRGGAIEHWVGIATDVETRVRRASLFEAAQSPDSPLALIVVDPDFRLLSVKLPHADQFPVDPRWTVGRRLADADPDMYAQMRPAHHRLLRGGGSELLEISRTFGEETFHRLLLFYPARVRGELISIGIVDLDITALKRTELAAERLAEERRALLQALVETQERERRRIAADIHGDTLQVLGALRLQVDALGAHLPEREQRAALAELEATFELATQRLRALLFELWPPSLDRVGLSATISELLSNCERDGLRTHLEVDLSEQLPLELRGVIYRVVAEALTNVRRHARARSVEVALRQTGGCVLASIHDDGVGFDPAAAPFGHVGLREMTDRVNAAGGSIEIHSTAGHGADIRLSVPVHPQ